MEIKFICCSVYQTNKPTWFNIINHGMMVKDKLFYTTNGGEQIKPIQDITVGTFITVVDPADIDMQRSLTRYFSKMETLPEVNNYVFDIALKEGIYYKENMWHYGLLIHLENGTLTYNLQ